MPKLKVFRTSTGFHDAYVAAPSQKAALQAWGVEGNLFAQGLAEQVSDERLMEEALAQPGIVIKKLRGTEAEHIAALGPLPEKSSKAAATGMTSPTPALAKKSKPAPRPNRAALDAATAALAQAGREHETALALLDKQLTELRRQRDALVLAHRRERSKLEEREHQERVRYDAALQRWRG